MMTENLTVGAIGGLLFVLAGLGLLLFAERMRRSRLEYFRRHPRIARLTPFLWWLESNAYVPTTQAAGVMTIVVGMLLLAFVLWKFMRAV